jgi:hypothetical protein
MLNIEAQVVVSEISSKRETNNLIGYKMFLPNFPLIEKHVYLFKKLWGLL